jgi:ankyrin repeat protein
VALLYVALWQGATAAPTDQGWTEAIARSDTEALLRQASPGIDVNAAGPNGKTALMVAASKGDLALLERLLELGAALDQRNRAGGTALMYAAQYGHSSATERLLIAGADANVRGAKGWTALMVAVLKRREAVIDVLLEHGADPNPRDMFDWTPLMRAVREDSAPVVRRLLADRRIEIDAANKAGMTALHLAASLGLRRMAALLLNHGADPRMRDLSGNTPLMLAEHGQHAEVAALLRR